MGYLFHAFKTDKLADVAKTGLLVFRRRIWCLPRLLTGVRIVHHDISGKVLQGMMEELTIIAGTSEAESTNTVVERSFAQLRRT